MTINSDRLALESFFQDTYEYEYEEALDIFRFTFGGNMNRYDALKQIKEFAADYSDGAPDAPEWAKQCGRIAKWAEEQLCLPFHVVNRHKITSSINFESDDFNLNILNSNPQECWSRWEDFYSRGQYLHGGNSINCKEMVLLSQNSLKSTFIHRFEGESDFTIITAIAKS